MKFIVLIVFINILSWFCEVCVIIVRKRTNLKDVQLLINIYWNVLRMRYIRQLYMKVILICTIQVI